MKIPAGATKARFEVTFAMPAAGVTFAPCIAVTDIPNVPNTPARVLQPGAGAEDTR